MNTFLCRAALVALAMIFLLAAPALAQEAPAAPEAAEGVGTADLPSAASELLSAASGGEEAALPSVPLSPAPRYGPDLLRALGMFILVIALLFITLKVIGRFGRFRAGKGQRALFKMRGVMALDNRKYLAAVEVEGHVLVLGVTQERIAPLAHWAAGGEAGDFAFHLREDEELPDISVSEARDGGEAK